MELNKRTKLTGGVLLLALAALGADKLLGDGPAGASAAEPSPVAKEAVAASGAKVAESAVPRGALAARLSELGTEAGAGPVQSVDVFNAPEQWFPPRELVAEDAPKPKPKARADESEKHVLKSLNSFGAGQDDAKDDRAGFATVDGHVLKLNQLVTFEGKDHEEVTYKLLGGSVRERRATVEIDGKVFELEMRVDKKSGAREDAGK